MRWVWPNAVCASEPPADFRPLPQVSLQTQMGQLMDMETMPEGVLDLNRYTLERYVHIVEYKTAFYSFFLPVAVGMVLEGLTSAEAMADARAVCLDMGTYFQIQDDYLDCYGDPEVGCGAVLRRAACLTVLQSMRAGHWQDWHRHQGCQVLLVGCPGPEEGYSRAAQGLGGGNDGSFAAVVR